MLFRIVPWLSSKESKECGGEEGLCASERVRDTWNSLGLCSE